MTVETVNQFRGLGAIGVGETYVPKSPGGSFQVNLAYQYQGPGGTFDFGIGLCPAATAPLTNNVEAGGWFSATFTIPPASTWTSGPVIGLSTTFPTTIALGLRDVRPFIQTLGGPRDPGGQGFLVSEYHRNVYDIKLAATQFSGLQATYL